MRVKDLTGIEFQTLCKAVRICHDEGKFTRKEALAILSAFDEAIGSDLIPDADELFLDHEL